MTARILRKQFIGIGCVVRGRRHRRCPQGHRSQLVASPGSRGLRCRLGGWRAPKHRDTSDGVPPQRVMQTGRMTLQIEETETTLTSAQMLTGWRREFCVELLGEGRARIFMRAVESPSRKAAELHRGVLFHEVNSAFADLAGCAAAAREPLEHLAGTATRQQPSKDNLFAAVTYDRAAWESVVAAVECWQRRPRQPASR
jgi:hypothetical protein